MISSMSIGGSFRRSSTIIWLIPLLLISGLALARRKAKSDDENTDKTETNFNKVGFPRMFLGGPNIEKKDPTLLTFQICAFLPPKYRMLFIKKKSHIRGGGHPRLSTPSYALDSPITCVTDIIFVILLLKKAE